MKKFYECLECQKWMSLGEKRREKIIVKTVRHKLIEEKITASKKLTI